ncbi:MAG: hypothetical protein Q9168_004592 [Polycauliona sp. 1 TL-2023]
MPIVYSTTPDSDRGLRQIMLNFNGRDLDAIVERVLTGDRMILVSPAKHVQTIVTVAGKRAPQHADTAEGREQPAEPLANESHQFTETRLLQRSVESLLNDLERLQPKAKADGRGDL